MKTLKYAKAAAIAAIQAVHDLTREGGGRSVSVPETYDALIEVAEFSDSLIESVGEALEEEES